MPDFDVTSPDGKTFRVSAPEGATQEQALAYAKRNMPKAEPEPSFPYDKPGTTYGDVLPLARDDKTGATSLAVPEMIRSPLRGAISMGKRIMGEGPAETQGNLTDEELGTVMAVGGRPSPRVGPRGAPLPASISPERAALAKEAIEKFDIPITGPQIGTNRTTKLIEDTTRHLPLSGAGSEELAIKQSFNRAVAKTFGEDAPAITQTVMDQAKRRIGGRINEIEKANQVKLDNTFMDDLADIEARHESSLTPEEFSVVKKQLNNALQHVAADDTIEGGVYGNLLGHNSALDRAIGNQNPNISKAAQEVKAALQDALERSLSGEDLKAYREARFQYKNMKTIEPLVNKSPDGNISPALLNGQVTSKFANRAFDVSGNNPLDRLAKIGQAFLKEAPSSGTAERAATKAGLYKAGELGGAALAGSLVGVPAAVGGIAGGLAAGRLAGNYLRSPGLARRTIERGLNPPRDTSVPTAPPVGLAVGDALNESPDPAKRALGAQ